MLKKYGFKQEEAELSLNANKHNQVTTIYYLLHKRYEKQGQLQSNFAINRVETPEASASKPQANEIELSCSPVKRGRKKNSDSGSSVGR
jgi:hypothetical protein